MGIGISEVKDILLGNGFFVRIIEFSRFNNFLDWEMKGVGYCSMEAVEAELKIKQPEFTLETFIKEIPLLRSYNITKQISGTEGLSIDFTASGGDVNLLEKFLIEKGKEMKFKIENGQGKFVCPKCGHKHDVEHCEVKL